MGYYEWIMLKKENANECERHNVFQEHQAKLAVINTFMQLSPDFLYTD